MRKFFLIALLLSLPFSFACKSGAKIKACYITEDGRTVCVEFVDGEREFHKLDGKD